jgi:hypothetical protein
MIELNGHLSFTHHLETFMAQVTGFDQHRWEVERFNRTVDDAHRLLIQAANEWAKGHPEQPSSRAVLTQIVNLFAQERFLTRPYGADRC